MGFKKAGARPMPSLACIGQVTEVPEAKLSQSRVYVVQRVKLQGYGPSRNINPMILYRPDWLTPDFDPESLNEVEDGAKLLNVYRNNISENDSISTLLGLCGCKEEAFEVLAGRIFDIGIDPAKIETDEDMETVMGSVTEVLSQFFVDEGYGSKVGYILRQQSEKTDEVNPETGKPIYLPGKYYEVKEYFDPEDSKRISSLKKSADKSDGKFKISFDDTPF